MRQRFGELPRETQKTINNICTRTRASGGCEQEMSMFLRCIKRNDWDVEACPEQRDALVKCSNSSSAKDFKRETRIWKTDMKAQLITFFSKKRFGK